jgi:hypothetical protein
MIRHALLTGAIAALFSTTSVPVAAAAPATVTVPITLAGAIVAGNVDVSGSVTWTAVSGDTGGHSYTIGTDSDAVAAYSLRWWEDSDDPCKFRFYKRNLDSGDVNTPERDFCNGSPGNEKWAERRGVNEYITAIQVCRNDKQDSTRESIKGIRLWGRVIDKNAVTLGPENGPDEDKHNHCEVWRTKVSCPAGQIATKIKVYYDTYVSYGFATDYGFARGISLGCRPIAED